MPLHIDQTTNTERPKEPGLVVAVFDGAPMTEVMCYFDGARFGPSAKDWVAAMCGVQVGQRLPWYVRVWGWRGDLVYWRRVTIDASSVVDELRKAMGG